MDLRSAGFAICSSRGLGDRACDIPHAPRGSQHLRLLNLQIHDRKVNLAKCYLCETAAVEIVAVSTPVGSRLSQDMYYEFPNRWRTRGPL